MTFIVFINAMNITLQLQGQLAAPEQMKAVGQSMVLGGQVLKMGVFAGILTGALSGYRLISVTGMNLTYSACPPANAPICRCPLSTIRE